MVKLVCQVVLQVYKLENLIVKSNLTIKHKNLDRFHVKKCVLKKLKPKRHR